MNAHRMIRWPSLLAGLFLSVAVVTCALNPQPEPPGADMSGPPIIAGTGGSAGDQTVPTGADASAGSGGSTGGAGGATGQGGAAVFDAAVDAAADAPAADAPADSSSTDALPDAEATEASDDGG